MHHVIIIPKPHKIKSNMLTLQFNMVDFSTFDTSSFQASSALQQSS